jgi:hypothetical protein
MCLLLVLDSIFSCSGSSPICQIFDGLKTCRMRAISTEKVMQMVKFWHASIQNFRYVFIIHSGLHIFLQWFFSPFIKYLMVVILKTCRMGAISTETIDRSELYVD